MQGARRKVQEYNNQFRLTLPKETCKNKGVKKQDVAIVEEVVPEREGDIAFHVVIRKQPLKLVEKT